MLENFIVSLNAIVPLFVLMSIGYILRKLKKVDDNFVKQANYIVFKLSLPLTLFSTVYNSEVQGLFNPKLIIYSLVALCIVVLALSFSVPKYITNPKTASAFVQSAFRSNFTLLGTVLAIELFGPTGALPTISLLPIIIPVLMILSIIVLRVLSQDNNSQKINIPKIIFEIITNPLILGILAALVLKLFQVNLPTMAHTSIDYLGRLATPLALIALGVQLKFDNLSQLKPVLACSFLKLIIIPIVVLVPACFLNFLGTEMGALFLLFSAPAGISNYALAYSMKSDYEFTGQVVVISTVLSLVTMLIGIMIFKTFGIF